MPPNIRLVLSALVKAEQAIRWIHREAFVAPTVFRNTAIPESDCSAELLSSDG